MGLFEKILENAKKQMEEHKKEEKLISYLKEIIKKENLDIEINMYDIQENCDDVLEELQEKGKLTVKTVVKLIRNGYRIREHAPAQIKKNLKCVLASIDEQDYQVLDYIDDKIIEQIPKETLDETLKHYQINGGKNPSKALAKNLVYVKKMIDSEYYYGNYIVLDYINDEIAKKLPKEYIIKAIKKGYKLTENTNERILKDRKISDYIIEKALNSGEYELLMNLLQYTKAFTKEDIETIYNNKKINRYLKKDILNYARYNEYFYNNLQFVKLFIDYGYGNIICDSTEECLKELSEETPDYIKKAIEKGMIIDRYTQDFIKNNPKYILQYILNIDGVKRIFDYDDLVEEISKETISKILNDKEALNSLSAYELGKLLYFSKNDNETLIEVISEKNNIDKEKLKDKLKYLQNKNNSLYLQLDADLLHNEFDFINIEVLNRIIPDEKITQTLLGYRLSPKWKTTKKILRICLDYIQNTYGQNTNYDDIIYKIITQGISTNNFDTLFEKIETLDNQQTKLLIKLLLDKENTYNITTPGELKKENFEKIIDEYFKNTEKKVKESNDIDYVKYEVLHKIYNITKEDVDLIFKRYCHNVDENKQTNSIVKNINSIMRCENINELKELYTKIKKPEFNYDKFWMYENDIRNEYIKEFNKSVYVPKQEDFVIEHNYGDKKLQIYKVKEDFNMIIHVYNAIMDQYLEDWERIKSDSPIAQYEDWNVNEMLNHGISCSYIGQNLFALAADKNPKFGFIDLENDSIIHMNSYDISTCNETFGETYTNIEDCFYTPENLIINTAIEDESGKIKEYNELVLERKKLKNKTQQYKRNPDYVVYLCNDNNETEIPLEVLLAAENFEKPIVIINMQQIVEREIKKIDDSFLKLEQTKNANILERIIIDTCCNIKSAKLNESLKKYSPALQERLNQIIDLIEKEKQTDEEFALNLYKVVLDVQKKYPLLDKSIIENLNQIMLNNQDVNFHTK